MWLLRSAIVGREREGFDMSIKQHATEAKGSRWFTPALSTAAVVLLAVPGIAAAGGRDMGSEDKSQMVAEAKAVENKKRQIRETQDSRSLPRFA